MPKVQVKKKAVQAKKSRAQVVASKPRQLSRPRYRSFRMSKPIKHPAKPVASAFRIFKASVRTLRAHWRLFGGIVIVYTLLTIVLVKGLGGQTDVVSLKNYLQELLGGGDQLLTAMTLLEILVSTNNSVPTDVAGAYQLGLLIITSLALIWTLRQVVGTPSIRLTVKEVYYRSMYPLIPFVLVLLVIGLQLVPIVAASFLYAKVIVGGLAVLPIEQVLWFVFLILLTILSLYMVISSVFALYIVTLPDVMPMQALRTARDLVLNRRLVILRKLLVLPIVMIVLVTVIMLPIIMFVPVLAEWALFILSMFIVALVHSYLYHLYRELIKDDL